MKLAILLAAAAISVQARDVYFDRANVLHPAFGAAYRVNGHRVELTRGAVTFHLADSGAPPVEIVTPSVTIQPYFAGDYRIEVNRFGESVITPYGGDLRIVAPSGTQWVSVGHKMIARGSPADPEFRVVANAPSRWRRIASLVAAAIQINAGAGGGSDDSGDATRTTQAAGNAPAKSDSAAKSPPPRPNDGAPKSASGTARGK